MVTFHLHTFRSLRWVYNCEFVIGQGITIVNEKGHLPNLANNQPSKHFNQPPMVVMPKTGTVKDIQKVTASQNHIHWRLIHIIITPHAKVGVPIKSYLYIL